MTPVFDRLRAGHDQALIEPRGRLQTAAWRLAQFTAAADDVDLAAIALDRIWGELEPVTIDEKGRRVLAAISDELGEMANTVERIRQQLLAIGGIDPSAPPVDLARLEAQLSVTRDDDTLGYGRRRGRPARPSSEEEKPAMQDEEQSDQDEETDDVPDVVSQMEDSEHAEAVDAGD